MANDLPTRIAKLTAFDERIEELKEELREESCAGHIASLVTGELDGVRWCKEQFLPLLQQLPQLVEALTPFAAVVKQHPHATLKISDYKRAVKVLTALEAVVLRMEGDK